MSVSFQEFDPSLCIAIVDAKLKLTLLSAAPLQEDREQIDVADAKTATSSTSTAAAQPLGHTAP
jgi:hypothetical protein